MYSIVIVLTSILLMVATGSEGKFYTRCQLAQTLYRDYKFPRNQLADWVCLIEAESGRDTRSVSRPNRNGSRDYGLYQINSFYWCSGGAQSRHNECRVPCSALANDNISDDVRCARLIFARQGFKAWYGWKNKCKGRNVQGYIAGCPL